MESHRDQCSICLEIPAIKETATVTPCSHTFCISCINSWVEQKSLCPLCNKEVTTVSFKDEKGNPIEKIVKPASGKANKDEDFSCFDHDYFITEYENLLAQAEDVEFNVKSLMNLKKNSSEIEKSYGLISHVIQELEIKLAFLDREEKLDPKQLVEDINHFSELLKNISYNPANATEKFIDYYDDQYDDYDEEYQSYFVKNEDDYFSAEPTFAVKTTNNKKKKKGKSKTSGQASGGVVLLE